MSSDSSSFLSSSIPAEAPQELTDDSTIEQRYRYVQAQIENAEKTVAQIAAKHAASDLHRDTPGSHEISIPKKVTLIAVSKFQPIEKIRALYDLGHRDFGENYAQELQTKAEAFIEAGITDIRWHFIGHLQTNKVKTLIPYITSVQSVDSVKLAQEISKRYASYQIEKPASTTDGVYGNHTVLGEKLSIFLHVNIDREESKGGVTPEETKAVVEIISLLPNITLEGLMCIPAPAFGPVKDSSVHSTHAESSAFARLFELEHACQPLTHGKLSMGMSDDFPQAILQHATHIRVGSLLFGKRT